MNTLQPLLNAGDEQERQQRLDELLRIHVAPIVRQVLLLRLGFSVSAQGVNEKNRDAEDLYQDALTRVIEVLNGDQQFLTTIEDFERYVRQIVSNICADFLRSKHPERARLKNALRDLLRGHRDLVSWHYEDEILCGFAAWQDNGKPALDAFDVDTKLKAFVATRFADEDVRVVPLSRVVAELFEWLGGPVQIDVLVRMLVYVRDVRQHQPESLDQDVTGGIANLRGSTRSSESDVETHELLGQLWDKVKGLTPKQRDAFALRFYDQAGRNLFTVLLAAGIVDLKDLAEGMERPEEEVARLWMLMPMDTATIVSELRTSRENIYKWRFRAIQKLKTELK